jgi:multiple antibiotic resistance protein
MMAVTYAFLLASPPIERMLGRTGTIVITRLLGMLLAALSVQFVIDGVRGTGLIG